MKRVLKHIIIVIPLFFICYILIFSFSDRTKTITETQPEYHPRIYVTVYGDKYHSADCHYLQSSKIAKSLIEAQSEGYTACSHCHGRCDGTIVVEKSMSKKVDNTPAVQQQSAFFGALFCGFLYLFVWYGLARTGYYGHKKSLDSDP